MVIGKQKLRVIDGGRHHKGKALRRKEPLTSDELRYMRCEYRIVLANNYIRQRSPETGAPLRKEMLASTRLLAEEAKEEGIGSEENLFNIAIELRHSHGLIRREAANFLALVAYDSEVFGGSAAARAAWHLVCNLCNESRNALYALGFSPSEIGGLKFYPDLREKELGRMLKEKQLII